MPPFPIFDAHLHIIDPRFPLVENQGYLPPTFDVSAYRAAVADLGVAGGAVVSGSFQAFDQTYLVDSLAQLGAGFVGVTQLPADVSEARIRELDAAGVRAVRFNIKRGGSAGIADLESLARRAHEVAGWHAELYIDSADLAPLMPVLKRLPKVSIDHLGLTEKGLPQLLELASHGASVKATGFGRVTFEVAKVLRAIWSANPRALVFGTDLPGTRAPRPFQTSDIDLVVETLGESPARQIFWENALVLYRLRPS